MHSLHVSFRFVSVFFFCFIPRKEGWTLIDFSGHIHSAQVTPCIHTCIIQHRKRNSPILIRCIMVGWINVYIYVICVYIFIYKLNAYVVICFAFYSIFSCFSFFFSFNENRWSMCMNDTWDVQCIVAFVNSSCVYKSHTMAISCRKQEWINRNIDLLPAHGNFSSNREKLWTPWKSHRTKLQHSATRTYSVLYTDTEPPTH